MGPIYNEEPAGAVGRDGVARTDTFAYPSTTGVAR